MISLDRYRLLLGVPDLARAIGASVVGRLPIGMAVISILLYVQTSAGSFAQAGLASALYIAGVGVLAPFIGRLIDRFGPRPVLRVGACVYPLALLALIAAVESNAGATWIGVTAMIAGAALPPIPTCMRALLRRLLHAAPNLQSAYSLDSLLTETIFILGPGLVSIFVALGWPAGAVASAALCGSAGAFLFLATPAVRSWAPEQVSHQRTLFGTLATPGLVPIMAATVCFSIGFGLFEVAVTAVAAGAGTPAAAGLILALTSVGSALGVLAYGSRAWPVPIARQYHVALAAMAIGFLLLAPVQSPYLFGLVCVVAGAPMATVLAAQATLIAGIARRGALAESFTWSSTCLLAGVSTGLAAGGWILEHAPPAVVLAAAGTSTFAAVLIALVGLRPQHP